MLLYIDDDYIDPKLNDEVTLTSKGRITKLYDAGVKLGDIIKILTDNGCRMANIKLTAKRSKNK